MVRLLPLALLLRGSYPYGGGGGGGCRLEEYAAAAAALGSSPALGGHGFPYEEGGSGRCGGYSDSDGHAAAVEEGLAWEVAYALAAAAAAAAAAADGFSDRKLTGERDRPPRRDVVVGRGGAEAVAAAATEWG